MVLNIQVSPIIDTSYRSKVKFYSLDIHQHKATMPCINTILYTAESKLATYSTLNINSKDLNHGTVAENLIVDQIWK